ncbi:hypothetical protein BCR33DRAFT_654813, partial [Rhizoclosmatium globosum]
ETEQILQSQYLLLQDKLLSSVDRQAKIIHERLNENELVLARTEDEKNTIGVNLYKANVQVGRLNEHLYVARKNEQSLAEERKVWEAERVAMKQEIQSMSEMNINLISQLNATKQRLDDATDKSNKLTDVNLSYNSDLKIHRRIENKLKNELQYVDQRRRVAEADLEDQKKITEKLNQNRNEMELIMEAQKQETGIANQTIAKMHTEISTLKAAKKKMEKQWEEAMTAMAKRDVTFQSVEQQKENIKETLDERGIENQSLKSELEQMTKNFTFKEIGKDMDILKALEQKQHETRGSLSEAQVAESLYKQELEKLKELERKTSTVSDMKGKIKQLKSDFDMKMRNEVIHLAAKKEDQVRSQAQMEIENIKRDQMSKNTDLRHINAEFQMMMKQKDEQLNDLTKEKESLRKSYTEINNHYNKLYDEARHLMYDLERREHDCNYLKAKLQEITDSELYIV